jgi:CTP synthase (UTP-ammonia lyase)
LTNRLDSGKVVIMTPVVRVALIGDYNPDVAAHQSIPRSLTIAGNVLGARVDGCWLATERIDAAPGALLESFDAFWSVPASPYRSTDGALTAIRFAREKDRPFLGTCGGFQHAILEFARNVLGRANAAHAEIDPTNPDLFLSPLACSLVEVSRPIRIVAGSRLDGCYGAENIVEGYHCSYGLNESRRTELEERGMHFSAFADDGTVRAFELTDRTFFVGTLFQPERAALRGELSPPVLGLLRAALGVNARSPFGSGASA